MFTLPQCLQPVEYELTMVRQEIEQIISVGDTDLTQAARYFMRASGKQMRPALVLLAAKCFNLQYEKAVRTAVAVELLHMASLVHDDIIDEAETRRGTVSVNQRWGNRVAVLLGDFFYGKALRQAALCGPAVVDIIGEVVEQLVAGELRQLQSSRTPCVDEGQYLERIREKTAQFISACCRLGARVGDAPANIEEALAEYGEHLGMAYQIRDDLLDVMGDPDIMGKAIGGDLRNGHLTLPVIHALHQGAFREEVSQILAQGYCGQSDLRKVICWLEKGGSIAYSLQRVSGYIELAKTSLGRIPPSRANQALQGLAEYAHQRVC